jgi:hypothetical protein
MAENKDDDLSAAVAAATADVIRQPAPDHPPAPEDALKAAIAAAEASTPEAIEAKAMEKGKELAELLQGVSEVTRAMTEYLEAHVDERDDNSHLATQTIVRNAQKDESSVATRGKGGKVRIEQRTSTPIDAKLADGTAVLARIRQVRTRPISGLIGGRLRSASEDPGVTLKMAIVWSPKGNDSISAESRKALEEKNVAQDILELPSPDVQADLTASIQEGWYDDVATIMGRNPGLEKEMRGQLETIQTGLYDRIGFPRPTPPADPALTPEA